MCTRYLLFILLCFAHYAECAKILCIFPVPSFSHQIVYRRYTKQLAKLGHEVIVATPIPLRDNTTNIREIDLSFSVQVWDKELKSDFNHGAWAMMNKFLHLVNILADTQLQSEEFQNFLKSNVPIDLLVVEYLSCYSVYTLKYKFNVPMVGITSLDASFQIYEDMGNFNHVYAHSDSHFGRTIIANTFSKRIMRIFEYLRNKYIYIKTFDMQMEIARRHIDIDFDSIKNMDLNPDFLFINANPILTLVRPNTPNIVDITGIHLPPKKPLSKDMQAFLDNATDGVVVFSLGSNIKGELLPEQFRDAFLQAFSEIRYSVVWKWGENLTTGLPKSVKICQWIQQNDILAHPNVKLFIFQGGYQSLVETVTNKVPVIGIPFYGDQLMNVQRIVHLKIGMSLDPNNMKKEQLLTAINTVITNPIYKENVVRLSRQLYDWPQSPMERAVWWTEYILRNNGSEQLKPPVRHLPYVQLLYLDAMLFASALLIASICITRRVLACIVNVLRRVSHGKNKRD